MSDYLQYCWDTMWAAMPMMSHTDPKDAFIEPEPGAVVVSSPSLKHSYTTMTNNLKMSIEKFNLRDCVLSSCQELNRAEFFLLLQASLLVFCPSLGLSILFQYYDVDDQFTDQQEQDEQYIEMIQQQQMTQEQTQFVMDQQQSMTQTQYTQMQQFVQFVQQLITSMRSDVAQQFMTESQQPQFAMTKSVKTTQTQSVTANNARIIAEEDNQGQDGEEDVSGNRPSGEGRQGRIAVKVTTKTWRTVVIHF